MCNTIRYYRLRQVRLLTMSNAEDTISFKIFPQFDLYTWRCMSITKAMNVKLIPTFVSNNIFSNYKRAHYLNEFFFVSALNLIPIFRTSIYYNIGQYMAVLLTEFLTLCCRYIFTHHFCDYKKNLHKAALIEHLCW